MALFGFKKKDAVKEDAPKAEKKSVPASEKKAPGKAAVAASLKTASISRNYAHVLKHPRITEKATMHAEVSAYLFDVAPNASKHDIARAVSELYKVTPRMVRVVTYPAKLKRNSRTGKKGVKQGGKKAYVYLKRGDSITIA